MLLKEEDTWFRRELTSSESKRPRAKICTGGRVSKETSKTGVQQPPGTLCEGLNHSKPLSQKCHTHPAEVLIWCGQLSTEAPGLGPDEEGII